MAELRIPNTLNNFIGQKGALQQQQQSADLHPFQMESARLRNEALSSDTKLSAAELERFTNEGNMRSMVEALSMHDALEGDPKAQNEFLVNRIREGQAQGRDMTDTISFIKAPPELRARIGDSVRAMAQQTGLISPQMGAERRIIKDAGGSQRFVDTGERVFDGVQPPDPKQTAVQERIALLEGIGVPNDIATKAALNIYKTVADPVFGDIKIVDETTGQMTDVDSLTLNAILENIPDDDTVREGDSLGLFSMVDETVTGAVPQFQEILQNTAGQVVDLDFLPPEVREKRQIMLMQGKDLVRAMMNSARFNEGERKALEKEISIDAAAWTSAPSLRSRMIAIDRSLRNRMANERRKAKSPSTNSKDVKEHIYKAGLVEDFLRNLNVPQGQEQRVDLGSLPADKQELIGRLSPEQQQEYLDLFNSDE